MSRVYATAIAAFLAGYFAGPHVVAVAKYTLTNLAKSAIVGYAAAWGVLFILNM